jgi:hypothetical protein
VNVSEVAEVIGLAVYRTRLPTTVAVPAPGLVTSVTVAVVKSGPSFARTSTSTAVVREAVAASLTATGCGVVAVTVPWALWPDRSVIR